MVENLANFPRLSGVQLVLWRDFLAVYWHLTLKLKTGRRLTENKKESEAHGDHVGSAISDNAMGTQSRVSEFGARSCICYLQCS